MMLLKSGQYADALFHLEICAAPNYRQKNLKAEALLWVGRCYDLLGMRQEAIDYYQKALEVEDKEISPAAGRHLKRPFSPKELKYVEVEFVTGGTLAKYE